MSKIKLLPEELAKKIAAGEVIERPFSVVKELVENSIDAGATKIKVELSKGGKKLIRVIDNGEGMTREDAQLAFHRHSTSKIFNELDLRKIKTLGFRGEALPSITAVSKVILKTRPEKENIGTHLEFTDEKKLRILDIAHPIGTTVEVRELFYNLPARKKFMRSEQTELHLIIKYLTQLALSYPSLQFTLFNEGRLIFSYPGVNNLKERIYQIYGSSFLEQLIEIDYQREKLHLEGFFSRPPYGRPNKAWQLFFVNKRPVKDKIISSAVNQAYNPFLEKGIFPIAFLFLKLPYEDVDVNVHPTKAEVRFSYSQKIFNYIYEILNEELSKVAEAKHMEFIENLHQKESLKIMESPSFFQQTPQEKILFPEKTEEKYPKILGQYLNSYILVQDKEDLLIIDQHNAHERILYEKYKNNIKNKEWNVQEALFPVLIDFTPSQQISFEKKKETLEKLGFKLESMGANTYALKTFPEILSSFQAQNILIALLEEATEKDFDNLIDSFIATLACKTATKVNQPLTQEKMEYLVKELFKTSNSSFCPHKRPIMVKITQKEIEKSLGRS
jgi:DNA mismatch repair protein MutL